MKSCLNSVTTGGRPKELKEWVQLAAKHGYAGVEFGAQEVAHWIAQEGLDAVHQYQLETGVDLAVFGLPVDWRGSEETFRKGLADLGGLADAAARAGCDRAATWVPPAVAEAEYPAAYALRVARRLRACCEVLGERGVSLAIEWVGTPSLRTGKVPFVWTLEHIVELCDAIGLPNAGLLFDSWHWYTTGSLASDLERIPASRIIHVHVNDAPDRPMEEQRDNVRLLPGESGVIDLVGMLSALRAKRYAGYVAIETFSAELPKLGVDGAAGKAKAALDSVMARV